MSARLTKEDRLQRLSDKTRVRVDGVPKETSSLRHMPSSSIGAMVREAGYERTSVKLLQEISNRLRDKGIDFFPELTDPANTAKTRIYFFDAKRPVKGLQPTSDLFKNEKELSRFLWLNREDLAYFKKRRLQVLSPETRIADGMVIDLLAVDKKTNELVGIELKAKEADDRLVGQAAKYMRALKSLAAAEGRQGARLLIVTGQPDDDLAERIQVHAETLGVPTEWLLYRNRFELY